MVKTIKHFINTFSENTYLFKQLVIRDFEVQYKRTVFGLGWSVLTPLLTMIIMRFIFYNFFGRSTPHYTTYLFCGTLIMNYYKDATKSGMSSLVKNGKIISKINVPKYMFLLSRNVSALINFGLSFIVFIIFCVIDGITFTYKLVALIYPTVCLLIMNIGIGMILSALYVFFKDISYMYSVFLTLLTYLSAIFYTIDKYSANIQRCFILNPVYCIIKYYRIVVIDMYIPTMQYHFLIAFYALVFFAIGCWMYKRYNHQFIYYL